MISRQHPFRLLASAVVGRPIYIAYLKDPSAPAYTDGEHIFVGMDAPLERQRNEILVQSLLLAGGSLQRTNLLGIVGRPLLRQRYLVLEVERCARLFGERLPTAFMQLLADYRSSLSTSSPEQSLALARGMRAVPAAPDWFGSIHPLRLLKMHAPELGKPLADAERAALEARLSQVRQELQEEDDAVKDDFWQWLSSPKGKDGLLSKLLRDLLDMSSSPDGKSADGGSGAASESVSGRLVKRLTDAANALRSKSDVVIPSAFLQPEAGAHSYPEWHAARQTYRSNWVTVEEVEPYTEAPLLSATALHGGYNARYQRALAGLCFNVERHNGQRFGDDLVLDRLVDLRVALRCGSSGDDRVYRANLRTRRDLGVQILLDASSSTLEQADADRRVCDLQAEVAWQLCCAFSLLGDRVAMHGFHSWGRTLVRFQRLKTFEERVGAAIERRIRNLSIAGYTRFGAAIRHGAEQLHRFSGMPSQLLLVISDGYPYDDQYEDTYAAEDTRKALEEARSRGIACVCLSIGSDADSSRLRTIYGDANYLAVATADQLAWRLRPVIEAAIGSAQAR